MAVLHMSEAEVVRYRLRQRFSYSYDGQAYDLRHRLVVVPPQRHGDQQLRLGSVEAWRASYAGRYPGRLRNSG